MKLVLWGAAALALGAPSHAMAQSMEHIGHQMPMPTPAPTPMPKSMQATTPPPALPAPVQAAAFKTEPGMEGMDHSAMPGMDHSEAEKPGMHHSLAGVDHGGQDMSGTRGEGSGTSRLPANEAMNHGAMFGLGGDAMLMLHGYAWGVYTDQSGPRGDNKTYVQSMAMATVTAPFEGGKFTGHTMLSLEPAMRHDGYPNLFATGEVAYGQPLVDRQHPHDLFMELSGRLDVDLAANVSAFLYGGPVGEPALGPSAFMHRASARYNPEAPITHHWFDSTHITYGVVTAGMGGKAWQLEASAFRGREPDEYRWDIETPKLDSWSVRASFAPSPAWLLQASFGHLNDPEEQHPGEDENRFTASAHFNDGGGLSAMAAFSSKERVSGDTLTAWLGEVNWDLTDHHTLFGRIENVKNDELFPDHASPLHDRAFRITKFQAGYAYRLPLGPFSLALGGTMSAFVKPNALNPAYGSKPMGYTLFAKFSFGD